MQVQLAKVYEQKRAFEHGVYSRKFDGKRMYYLDGVAYSRDNKECRPAPIEHITEEILACKELEGYVPDGEVLYFGDNFEEDFKRGISLTSRIARHPDCENLRYVLFDIIPNNNFLWEIPYKPFKEEYEELCAKLNAKPIPGRVDVLQTNFPHIWIARQTTDLFEMTDFPQYKDWEGLMYRNLDAPYEYKRSGNLLKMKKWQDIECKVVGIKAGIGKHLGRLGALIVDYKGYVVAVGSGFNDQEREILWRELKEGGRLYDSLVNGELYIKVKYFEESTDADGNMSLRFPTYLCFIDTNLGEFVV